MIGAVRDILFSTLFPQPCYCCSERLTTPATGNACKNCWDSSVVFDGSETVCDKCGGPELSGKHTKCRQCDGHEYDIARAVGFYSHALRAAVVALKAQPQIPRQLNEFLVDAAKRYRYGDSDLIVPVPLSKQRHLERGFNQADVIARALGTALRVPVDGHSLIRKKHSQIHRVGMDEKARDLSVRDSFEVARPKLIQGRRVLLVDDVLTTGATASYCAKALKRAGAVQVSVFTIARAV